jgi:hypothetical protein
MSKRDPAPIALCTFMAPSCLLTISRTLASPRPLPSGRVVKNGSNIRSSVALSMPRPESEIETIVKRPGPISASPIRKGCLVSCTSIRISTAPESPIACAALLQTFRMTCCNCAGSPQTSRFRMSRESVARRGKAAMPPVGTSSPRSAPSCKQLPASLRRAARMSESDRRARQHGEFRQDWRLAGPLP